MACIHGADNPHKLGIEMKKELTQERLRELLDYNPETGVFTWKVKRRGYTEAGNVCGKSLITDGYQRIQVERRGYAAHRLAWLHVTGEWPKGNIDHINGIRHDNRIANLRDIPASLNRQNLHAATSRNKSSNLLGVSWHNRPRPWRSTIRIDGKRHHLGYFETKEAAFAAYVSAKRQLHVANDL